MCIPPSELKWASRVAGGRGRGNVSGKQNACAWPAHPVNPRILMRILFKMQQTAKATMQLQLQMQILSQPCICRYICISAAVWLFWRCHSTGRNYCYSNWSAIVSMLASAIGNAAATGAISLRLRPVTAGVLITSTQESAAKVFYTL